MSPSMSPVDEWRSASPRSNLQTPRTIANERFGGGGGGGSGGGSGILNGSGSGGSGGGIGGGGGSSGSGKSWMAMAGGGEGPKAEFCSQMYKQMKAELGMIPPSVHIHRSIPDLMAAIWYVHDIIILSTFHFITSVACYLLSS